MKDDEVEKIRVIAYVPVRTNQLLQAHASLEGIAKQSLIAEILKAHAETLDIAKFHDNKEKRTSKKKARKSKPTEIA